jgi:tripartite-type tricarboxylate transporter receptor subunit TctC
MSRTLRRAALLPAILLAGASLTGMEPQEAHAQTYPDRPVTIILPYPPGGGADTLARALGEGFQRRTGQTLIVESRPGANTSLAARTCKSAQPDGYTICLLPSASVSINPILFKDTGVTREDFAPVTRFVFINNILLANSSVPANNLAELVEWTKSETSPKYYAHYGKGSENNLMMEWLKSQSGIELTGVPFAGAAPSYFAFDRGDVQFLGSAPSSAVLERISSGKAKALLVVGDEKIAALPDLPTLQEAGLPPLNFTPWFGIFAPAGTQEDVVEKLNAELRAVVDDPAFSERYLTPFGMEAATTTPDEFEAFLEEDGKSAVAMIARSGVTVE